MKMGWTGLESAGKSQLMAVHAVSVLHRNKRWKKKREKLGLPFVPRTMAFDSPMSQRFIDAVEKDYGGHYKHFNSFSDMHFNGKQDIFIHEILNWFPQRGSEPLTRDQLEFLTQGAKEGNNIYFCSQDFSQAHKQFRILVNHLYQVTKLIGSSRPDPSAPPVKLIWGVVLYWELDPRTFKSDNMSMDKLHIVPKFYFINREDTELYDTSYRVRGINMPPVQYVEQERHYLNDEGAVVTKKKGYVKR